MKTDVQTPMEVFHLPQRLVVPLFQRPYVWNEDDQWGPLWQDIRRIAELKVVTPQHVSHFLGAVVLQADEGQQGKLSTSNVIDGQQRLTTLQLIFDATALLLEERELDDLASQLDMLTHNPSVFVPTGSRLKLRHTNRDRDAFDSVMEAEPPVEYAQLQHSSSQIVKAHAYFHGTIETWLGEPGSDRAVERAEALVSTLTSGLQLVTINLTATENSQEIFETLNARGAPLTAADLIKNFVFQRLAIEGEDTKRAYSRDWPFDTKFWEEGVSVGRFLVSRSSLFLNQWLIARTGEEIGPNATFTRFKTYVEHESTVPMGALLRVIHAQAADYESWTLAAKDPDRQLGAVEMAVYRMSASSVEILKPVLIWLHEPAREVPVAIIESVVGTLESWLMRRQLLRLTGSDLSRVIADVIRANRESDHDELPSRVTAQLARLNVQSTYWPGDDEIRSSLHSELAYRRFSRSRLRMLLETVENRYRAESGQPQVPRRSYPIEHVMPQRWVEHWTLPEGADEIDRDAHIHRLGNLTLLTTKLNSAVSNGAWTSKREAFEKHNTMLLTSRLIASTADMTWDEHGIDRRSDALIDQLLAQWPVPDGHVGLVEDRTPESAGSVEVKALIGAGLVDEGTELFPRPGKWRTSSARVLRDGQIELDGQTYETLSGAGRALRGAATNGWFFWRLGDGRTLNDVREEYLRRE